MNANGAGRSGQPIHRNHVHEIHQEHEAENRDRERRDQLALAVKRFFHRRVDELDDHLDEALEFARHTGRGAPRHSKEHEQKHGRRQQLEEDAVEMEHHESATFADRHLQMMEMVLDVIRHGRRTTTMLSHQSHLVSGPFI